MATSLNNITPPRVALLDQRTGLIAREWYLFLLNLFQKVGGSTFTLEDLQVGPDFTGAMAAYDQAIEAVAQAALLQPVPDFDAQFRDLAHAALTEPRVEPIPPLTELSELTDVSITSPADGDLLIYDSGTGAWVNAQLTAGTNITITPGPGSISIAAAGVTGATGDFTTVDLKTVTVVDGIITSIV